MGERWIDVAEFSKGTRDEDAARHLMGERERAQREELMLGPLVVLVRAVIADVFEAYLSRPKLPASSAIASIWRGGSACRTRPESKWNRLRADGALPR